RELDEQARMNADPVNAWLMACAEAGEMVGSPSSFGARTVMRLGTEHHTQTLFERFSEWNKYYNSSRSHASDSAVFGKVMKKTLGEERHHHNLDIDLKRRAGYTVPDTDTLTRLVDKALGIPPEGAI